MAFVNIFFVLFFVHLIDHLHCVSLLGLSIKAIQSNTNAKNNVRLVVTCKSEISLVMVFLEMAVISYMSLSSASLCVRLNERKFTCGICTRVYRF